MNIKEKFISLTRWTYPHGSEHLLRDQLPTGFKKDKYNNYYLKIGESKTLFTCHLDTASKNRTKVTHTFDNSFIKSNGTTILGADDKAGMCVLLYMIENKIPGTYYFFIGEEVGCVGSRRASVESEFKKYDRCVSFDRRGYNSIITHQMWERCCSKEFSEYLCDQLNKNGLKYKLDDTGIVKDSASFMGIIPECTNISVGYFNEHTTSEKQDINFLKKLCEAVILIEWEKAPTCEFKKESFIIEEMNEIETLQINSSSDKMPVYIGNDVYLARIKSDRVLKEKSWIFDWVLKTGSYVDLKSVEWDGKICYVNFKDQKEFLGERRDLIYILDELSEIPLADLVLLSKI